MGRIWRALKLGMKSLLLHKLRSGLTVLGIVFGVAAVISMLSIAEGSSREARERIQALGATNIILRSVKPSDEVQSTGGRPPRVLNYGLKYADFDRMVETIPTIRKILPIREIQKQIRHGSLYLDGRVVGTTHEYADFNLLQIEKGRFLTASDNERYRELRRPRPRDGHTALPLREPDQSIGQARHRLLYGRGRDGGARQLGRDRRQRGGPGLQQGRVHPPQYLQAALRRKDRRQPIRLVPGRRDPAHPDHRPGRRRSTR